MHFHLSDGSSISLTLHPHCLLSLDMHDMSIINIALDLRAKYKEPKKNCFMINQIKFYSINILTVCMV
jgi:hypothetical protein